MSVAETLVREHLKTLEPYSSARDEYTGTAHIYLDANENAFGSVAGDKWNRYPDPNQRSLKKAIAGIKAVPEEKIFLGNGSDEPIDLLIRAFCEPGRDKVMMCPPTYGMYGVAANIHNVQIQEVSLTEDFQLDVAGMKSGWDPNTKLIFICSPNNPTGNKMQRDDILEVVRNAPGLVVVDEAYIDFSPEDTLLRYLEHFENLVILQTFSKAWGLAAFRLGTAYANPEVLHYLNKIKPPYNISGIVQQKALSGLLNFQRKEQWVKEMLAERERLALELESFDFVEKVFPSDANFLLVRFKEAHRAYLLLKNLGIIVRDRRKTHLCNECLRITVGTHEENDKLLTELAALTN